MSTKTWNSSRNNRKIDRQMVYANACFTPNNYKNHEEHNRNIKTGKNKERNHFDNIGSRLNPHASSKVTSITKTQMVLYHQNGQRET